MSRVAKVMYAIVNGCSTSTVWVYCGLLIGPIKPFARLVRFTAIGRSYWFRALSMFSICKRPLDQMNIKLHHVIDDLTGMTGMAIIESILSGERDPRQLAKHRDRRIKASQETILEALEGDWRSEHLFVLRLGWENWRQAQGQIQKCDHQLLEYTRQLEACTTIAKPVKIMRLSPQLAPSSAALSRPSKTRNKTSKNQPEGPWREELLRCFGVDLTAIPGVSVLTGITLLTELGNDLSAFKTAHHFSSWLCLCPDNETSASKVLRRATRRSQSRVRQALRMAASTLYRDKSSLGDKFRRLRAKLGAPKAITAMAHQLARIIWHLIVHRVPFDLTVFALYEQANQLRRLKSLASGCPPHGLSTYSPRHIRPIRSVNFEPVPPCSL